jgi:hypothetical protein
LIKANDPCGAVAQRWASIKAIDVKKGREFHRRSMKTNHNTPNVESTGIVHRSFLVGQGKNREAKLNSSSLPGQREGGRCW